MDLPQQIPQLDDDSQAWARFIEKAAKGSTKAAEMLTLAKFAVIAEKSGKRLHETEPLPKYLAFISDLQLARWPATKREKPLNTRAFYDSLWKHGKSVDPAELTDDALIHLRENWSMKEYVRLKARIDESGPDYNSQDVVAAMILLLHVEMR
jgi:hypothetical protein